MPMHFLHAQNTKLSGILLSSKSSEPLADANVYVKNLKLGSATDLNGQFSINNLPLNNIELEISIVGYRDTTLVILIDKSIPDNFAFCACRKCIGILHAQKIIIKVNLFNSNRNVIC